MEFDWTTLLWIGGFALLFWFMMRACGGMIRGGAGGGCGMGGGRESCEREERSRRDAEEAERESLEPERKRE